VKSVMLNFQILDVNRYIFYEFLYIKQIVYFWNFDKFRKNNVKTILLILNYSISVLAVLMASTQGNSKLRTILCCVSSIVVHELLKLKHISNETIIRNGNIIISDESIMCVVPCENVIYSNCSTTSWWFAVRNICLLYNRF
jgi:hypothetical protein